jgi:hypothetical protein
MLLNILGMETSKLSSVTVNHKTVVTRASVTSPPHLPGHTPRPPLFKIKLRKFEIYGSIF